MSKGHMWLNPFYYLPNRWRFLRWRRRWIPRIESLKYRLTLGISVLMLGVLYIIYSALSYTNRETAGRQALKYAEDLSSYFSATIAEAVAAKDSLQTHVLSHALLDNGAAAISVRNAEGEVLYAFPDLLKGSSAYSSPDLEAYVSAALGKDDRESGNFIHISKPVRFGEALVGEVCLWFSRTEFESRAGPANAFVYPIFALGFLLMLFLGISVLHTPFRTLRRVTHVADRIGSGDLSVRVPVQGHDEIANFCKSFNSMVDGLSQARRENQREHLQSIRAMISAVEAKDSYTQGHCVRVQHYARKILENYADLPDGEKSPIDTAALLHDIGKIGVPDDVLRKAHGLDEEEVAIIRSHVTIGEHILLHLDSMKEVARWVRHHHERWDGLGYPDGLRGESIPFASRVINVADSMDAMLTDRPYHKAMRYDEAIEVLKAGKGQQFDPRIVQHAITHLRSKVKIAEESLQT